MQGKLKKKAEVHAISEGMTQDAKVYDGVRTRLRRALKQLQKDRKDEKVAKEVQEEMQRNVEEGTGASVRIGRKYVGTRSWKTEQPQHEDLANDAEQQHEIKKSGK